LAEVVITPDKISTGFMEDIQLICQLMLDQGSLKIKLIVKGASSYAQTTCESLANGLSLEDEEVKEQQIFVSVF